jgi:hypothetical protein
MSRPDGIEPVTEGFSIYPKDGGWRVWCLRTDADAEPHQPVNYATPHIARIVAESLQFACNM